MARLTVHTAESAPDKAKERVSMVQKKPMALSQILSVFWQIHPKHLRYIKNWAK